MPVPVADTAWLAKSAGQHPRSGHQKRDEKRELRVNFDKLLDSKLVQTYFDEEKFRQIAGDIPPKSLLRSLELPHELERKLKEVEQIL
ncbi:hypothetical protein [Mariprofundus sp. KV]|uniref:hypothetical protein n=1 Tax=Mariprofundus sp. KV TaxID=2608715 RepID=UPI0015A1AFF9|nr:hypothetical protein [Mariprofundus sp. KV]NWF35523.1 hypothetical protein [Mariprofundus sp. KV]